MGNQALIYDVNYTCGNIGLTFAGMLPKTISIIITIIQIVVPILLVFFGLLDMAKAVMAQKEDEIKKGQQTLIKRVIAAAIVFFVILLVKMLLPFLSNNNSDIIKCFNCFVSGDVDEDACVEKDIDGGSSGNGTLG